MRRYALRRCTRAGCAARRARAPACSCCSLRGAGG